MLRRTNPTEYLGDIFFDASEESLTTESTIEPSKEQLNLENPKIEPENEIPKVESIKSVTREESIKSEPKMEPIKEQPPRKETTKEEAIQVEIVKEDPLEPQLVFETPLPEGCKFPKTFADMETQPEALQPTHIETQTEVEEKPIVKCEVCGGNIDCALHKEYMKETCPIIPPKAVMSDKSVGSIKSNVEPQEMSPSLINLCSAQTRNQLFMKNITAIKRVALNLLEVCDNPTDTDVDSDVKILQTLSKNLKTLKTTDPTVCVPVIIRLDKRMVAGEGGSTNHDARTTHSTQSDRSIRFSISHDLANDILDEMEDDMGQREPFRRSGFQYRVPSSESEVQDNVNVAEKPLTNSSPKGSVDRIINKYIQKNPEKRHQPSPGNIPQIARNITKLLKEKRNKEKVHKVHKAMKEKHSKQPLTPQCSPTSFESDDIDTKVPMKLGMNIKSTNKEFDIPNMGMCSYRFSGGSSDLVCPFTEQTECDCLVKLPSFLSKSNI